MCFILTIYLLVHYPPVQAGVPPVTGRLRAAAQAGYWFGQLTQRLLQ